jgi:hypothetical protein
VSQGRADHRCPTSKEKATKWRAIIPFESIKEVNMMTSRVREKAPAWSIESSLVAILGLPPKDPDHSGDDENEEDEDEDNEEDEEPGVIREPDEC